MKKKVSGFIFIILILVESVLGSQQIETVIFPSEDEISEAFLLGEINFEQFLILTELITYRIEPTSFLLQEIPHSLFRIDTTLKSLDNQSQAEYFLEDKKYSRISIKHRYSSYLDENSSSRYQSTFQYERDNFSLSLDLKKEYSGRERITRRYLAITPVGKNYNIIVGNFIKRFGLGGILGYRGKLLSYSENIDAESIMYPDFGGQNGIYVKTNLNRFLLESAISYNKNNELSHSISTFSIKHKNNKLPTFIIGVNTLTNRNLNSSFVDTKTSLYKKFIYSHNYISSEFVTQFNNQQNSYALLIDVKHRMYKTKLSYAFWKYGKSYIDLSSGSKTSLISEYVEIEKIQDTILSKRTNQIGGILKSQIILTKDWHANIATLYAYKNSDSTELQLYSQLSRKINSNSQLSIDMLYRNKERNTINELMSQQKYKSRIMLVINIEKFYLKNYFSILQYSDEPLYAGLFSEMKYKSTNYGLIHLWLNFSRLNTDTNQIDYFYGFIKNDIQINNLLYLGFKISHRYSRSSTDKIQNQFSIDMRWQL